jgi:hypothetical protein
MKNYEPIKLMNPDLPFLVREAPNVDSVLHVTYGEISRLVAWTG